MAGLSDIIMQAKQNVSKYNPFGGADKTAQDLGSKFGTMSDYSRATNPGTEPATGKREPTTPSPYAIDRVKQPNPEVPMKPGLKGIK